MYQTHDERDKVLKCKDMTLMTYSTASEAGQQTHDFRNDESFKQIS